MKKLTRWVLLGVGQLAMLLALATGVTPAQADGGIWYVDDDGAQCATTYTTIQSAVNAAEHVGGDGLKTIVVCQGSYPEQVQIDSVTNLVLQGRQGAVVSPPTADYNHSLIWVGFSDRVTVSDLTIDGMSELGEHHYAYAIDYYRSSGSVLRNRIFEWETADPSMHYFPLIVSAIYAHNDTTTPKSVMITLNTISEYEEYGIEATGTLSLDIESNNIINPVASSLDPVGIKIHELSGGGTIKSNTVNGAGTALATTGWGIYMDNVSYTSVTHNKVREMGYGIWLNNDCLGTLPSIYDTISVNTIVNANVGIRLGASDSTCTYHTDFDQVTHNQITANTATPGLNGILLEEVDRFTAPPSPSIHAATVQYNTITHYTVGLNTVATPGGPIDGVFSPNTIIP